MVDILRRFDAFPGQDPGAETVEYLSGGETFVYNLLPNDNSLLARQIRQDIQQTSVQKVDSSIYTEEVTAPIIGGSSEAEKLLTLLLDAGASSNDVNISVVNSDMAGARSYLNYLRLQTFISNNGITL